MTDTKDQTSLNASVGGAGGKDADKTIPNGATAGGVASPNPGLNGDGGANQDGTTATNADAGAAAAAASSNSDYRAGDWQCPQCNAHVFGRNISCFRCQAPKPGTSARHGDWVCLNKSCLAHNYASRQVCYRCQVPKGSEKPGDWLCINCRSNNFASRHECFRCRFPRPPGYGTPVVGSVRPGDWFCPNPNCGVNVFANRDSCFRCRTQRPANAEVANSYSDLRPGDWMCTACDSLNFAHRTQCFRCEAPKPENPTHPSMAGAGTQVAPPAGHAPPPPYHQAPPQPYFAAHHQYYPPQMMAAPVPMRPPHQYRRREGDWECPSCRSENFARREVCYKCSAPKPAGGVNSAADEGAAPAPVQ